MTESLGSQIDALWKLREKIDAAQAKVNALKDQQAVLEDTLIAEVSKADLGGARGKLARVAITKNDSASIADFTKFEAWVLKKKDLSVFQRRLSITHIRELRENKVTVPGITIFTKVGLSLTKL